MNYNVGGSFSLTNISNLILVLFKIKGTILKWENKFTNGKKFLLRKTRFFEFWSHVINHYLVKFGVHRTCGVGDIAFFICPARDYTYSHVIKEPCDKGICYCKLLLYLVIGGHGYCSSKLSGGHKCFQGGPFFLNFSQERYQFYHLIGGQDEIFVRQNIGYISARVV